MKVLVLKNKNLAAKKASELIAKEIKKKQNSNLLLATGSTMIPVYKNLVQIYKRKKISFSKVISFNLDEYAGLDIKNKNSYHYFMKKHLFSKVNLNERNNHFPDSNGKEYERKIKKSGGIDLAILGIGENAHIAFNEPGSSEKSLTRKIKLSEKTRKVNSRLFSSKKEVPKYAYTVGIKTILSSKKIILIAFGEKKSQAVHKALEGPIGGKTPASFLRKRKNVIFILDKKAVSKIQDKKLL